MTSIANADELIYSIKELKQIHFQACMLVEAAVNRSPLINSLPAELGGRPVTGIFVSLKRGNTLRGCRGVQGVDMELHHALEHSARGTAWEDMRFAPISSEELAYLELSVSILGAQQELHIASSKDLDKIRIGTSGLRIQLGNKAGLLLPAVARERRWNARQFLEAVCRKAGLAEGSWRRSDARLKVFSGVDYSAPLLVSPHLRVDKLNRYQPPVASIEKQSISILNALLENNSIPYEESFGLGEGCQGLAIKVTDFAYSISLTRTRFSVRSTGDLNSWLLKTLQSLAQELKAERSGKPTPGDNNKELQVDIAVLCNAIHHGAGRQVDLRGIDTCKRALLMQTGSQVSLCYKKGVDAANLYAQANSRQAIQNHTQTYSVDCYINAEHLSVVDKSYLRQLVRPSAVSGRFYPADDAARNKMIDNCLSELAAITPHSVNAAMVPHAGLRYSGRIACDVWRRIKLPSSVIIVGPKHTSHGANWAVSPCSRWALSNKASMPADLKIAKLMCRAVSGMVLDSEAHRHEHSIEVQLPVLYRIKPDLKIVGVAMCGGSFEKIQAAARSMAEMMRQLNDPPLLVISSDMNHYQSDTETRRRDNLALQALRAGDAVRLLRVCRQEKISMCGQVAAAFVLLTMNALGRDLNFAITHYATSGDVTNERQNVVGYAGVTW